MTREEMIEWLRALKMGKADLVVAAIERKLAAEPVSPMTHPESPMRVAWP